MDISSIGPAAAAVLITLAFLKYMADDNTRKESQHKETMATLGKLNDSMDTNTAVTQEAMELQKETTAYLKHRNGSFERLIKEQPQIHQLVKDHFEGGESESGKL